PTRRSSDLCSSCTRPFQIVPSIPTAATPWSRNWASTIEAGKVTIANSTYATAASPINQRSFIDRSVSSSCAVQHEARIDEPRLGSPVDRGRLDADGVSLLQVRKTEHELVELGTLEANTDSVRTGRCLARQCRGQATFARCAVNQDDERFATGYGCRWSVA